MRLQRLQFLNLRHLPARLTAEEAGWLLGYPEHQIPILVSAGLLKPLGQPAPNAFKYFATATLCEPNQDVDWQSRASKGKSSVKVSSARAPKNKAPQMALYLTFFLLCVIYGAL
jgi:hypothetical protein